MDGSQLLLILPIYSDNYRFYKNQSVVTILKINVLEWVIIDSIDFIYLLIKKSKLYIYIYIEKTKNQSTDYE